MKPRTIRTRGARLRLAAVLSVVLLAAAASGQWLEDTIYIGDSHGSLRSVDRLLYNSGSNTVYVAGRWGDDVAVIDASTYQKVASVPVTGSADFMCYNDRDNKVYCASMQSDSVYVIDGATHQLVAAFGVPAQPRQMCYCPTENKVYCACYVARTVAAIDCDADSVVALIPMTHGPRVAVSVPDLNKVYCSLEGDTAAVVIDCAADTVAGAVLLADCDNSDMVYNPDTRKLYFVDRDGHRLVVVDAVGDSMLDIVALDHGPYLLALNRTENKVYAACNYGNAVIIIDGDEDSVIVRLPVGNGTPAAQDMAWDSLANVVYTASPFDRLVVLDGVGDSIVGEMPVGQSPSAICCGPARDQVYVAHSVGDDVWVVDADRREVVHQVRSYWPAAADAATMPSRDKLYIADSKARGLVVVAPSTNRVVGFVELDFYPRKVLGLASLDLVLAVGYTQASIVDAAADTVVATLVIQPRIDELSFRDLPGQTPKVYCAKWESSSLTVFDPRSGAILGEVEVGDRPTSPVYAPREDRVYCISYDAERVCAIDCSTDSLVAARTLGQPLLVRYVPGHRYVCTTSRNSELLEILDADSLGHVASLPTWKYELSDMLYYDKVEKMYVTFPERLFIYDMDRLTLTDSVVIEGEWHELAVDTVGHRVYCTDDDLDLTIVDAETDRVVRSIPTGSVYSPVWDPASRCMYLLDGPYVQVVKDSGVGGILEKPGLLGEAVRLPTILRGPELVGLDCRVIDAMGRDVTDRRERLAPGVYFLRPAADREPSGVRKVVLQR